MDREKRIHILLADDDEDDRMLTAQAFTEGKLNNTLSFVNDGQDLLDYLNYENGYTPENAKRPGLILLDLNMPKKDGRECLKEIKNNPTLRHIPVVVLTTSRSEQDVFRTYDLGVNSFIVKPVTFKELVDIIVGIDKYWFQIVELPN